MKVELNWFTVDVLPKHGERCIVKHKYGVSEAECWRGNSSTANKPSFQPPYYGQITMDDFEEVTHWMSMPSPPIKNG